MKLTGTVLSNDGELAKVELSNGERLTIRRIDPLCETVSMEKFLEDLPVGEMNPDFLIQKMFVN